MLKKEISELAFNALISEVNLAPKPGLVTPFSNGSHKDMNFQSFVASANALRKYFEDIFEISKEQSVKDLDSLFLKIRQRGKDAEKEMFEATRGINTHKGSIFSLGIVFSVFVFSYFQKLSPPTLEEISANIKYMCRNIYQDFENDKNILYEKYGIMGARQQAYQGYACVFEKMENTLHLAKVLGEDHAFNLLLIYYISIIDDSNIIKRSSLEKLNEIREICKRAYQKYYGLSASKDDFVKYLEKLGDYFVELNISPGGSADLIILSYFIYFLLRGNYVRF